MKRTKWSVSLRNRLSSLAMECDSCAAVDEAKMSTTERDKIQSEIFKTVEYIDSLIKAR